MALEPKGAREWLKIVGLCILTAFILAQCVSTTEFGITNGRAIQQDNETNARILVNFAKVPAQERTCYFASATFFGPYISPWYQMAVQDHRPFFNLTRSASTGSKDYRSSHNAVGRNRSFTKLRLTH